MPGVFKLLQKITSRAKSKTGTRVLLIVKSKRRCTSFFFSGIDKNSKKYSVMGRTMEHSAWMRKNKIVVVPAGLNLVYSNSKFNTSNSDNKLEVQRTPYGYLKNVAYHVTDTDVDKIDNNTGMRGGCEGLNEKGLSIDLQSFHESCKFLVPDDLDYGKRKDLTAFNLVDYILGNCDTIESVKNMLDNVYITIDEDLNNQMQKMIPKLSFDSFMPFHFHLVDATGEGLVIEVINDNGKSKGKGKDKGKQFYFDSIGVCTNEPPYPWHKKNITLYPHLTNKVSDKVWDKQLGHGAGTIGMPGDILPSGRFIRTYAQKQWSEKLVTDTNSALIQTSNIIDSINLTKGIIIDNEESKKMQDNPQKFQGIDTSYDYTIWSVMKDLQNVQYYIKPYNDAGWSKIDAKELIDTANQWNHVPAPDNFTRNPLKDTELVQQEICEFVNYKAGDPWKNKDKIKSTGNDMFYQ